MCTGAEVVDEARGWIGTPFLHLARERGKGVDCLGLILGVCWSLGIYDRDHRLYGRVPSPEYGGLSVENAVAASATRIERPETGALAYIQRVANMPHFAILDCDGSGCKMIHADASVGRVVECGYDGRWRRRTRALFRLPGVRDG